MGNDPLNRDKNLENASSSDVICDGSESVKEDEIYIPDFYGLNRVTLLLVNSKRQFLYWELTEEYLQEKIQSSQNSFKVRVFLNAKPIDEFLIEGRNGSYYTNYHYPFGSLRVEVRSLDDQILLESNEMILPSDILHEPNKEVWMTKKHGEILTKRFSGTLTHDNILNSQDSLIGMDSLKMKEWQKDEVSMKEVFKKEGLKAEVSSFSSHSLGEKK